MHTNASSAQQKKSMTKFHLRLEITLSAQGDVELVVRVLLQPRTRAHAFTIGHANFNTKKAVGI
jgi:hypothetical protein